MTLKETFARSSMIARNFGAEYADLVFTSQSPPWTAEQFLEHVDKIHALAAEPFAARPDTFSALFVMAMQLAALRGFEDRIKAIRLSVSGTKGGRA